MTSSNSDNWILDGIIVGQLRAGIEDVFEIVSIQTPREAPKGTILFLGRLLKQDSEAVFDYIEAQWRKIEYTPMLRQHKDGHIALIAQPGIVEPKPANPLINLGLAIATILSVWFTGTIYECQCTPSTLEDWLSGLPMMLALMIILLAHEFGHYFAAKYHKVDVTLPYFIPLPLISPVGTLGAFIQLKTPFKTKQQLFDIGIAGPIGGLIFAVPLLFWGMATSEVHQLTRGQEATSVLEGNSIFYLGVKYLIHGDLLPGFDQYADLPFAQEFALLLVGWLPSGGGTDVLINSVAFAAWFGLFITAMNLLPVGQLDGGHIIYSLMGDSARWLGMVLVAIMVLAGFWWSGWWVWSFLVFFVIGVKHPPPLNELVPISTGRKILAYLIIFAFIILFMPNPLQPL